MNRNLLLVGCAREKSSRTRNKMIRPLNNTTLFEIYLKKLETIQKMDNPFDDIIMAISRKDNTLWKLAEGSEVKIIERNEKSILTETRNLSEIYHFLSDFNQEYFMLLNGCLPFLKPSTIIKAGEFFKECEDIKSMTCAKYTYNFFWEGCKPINNPDEMNSSTASVNPLIEQVHSFHISNRKYLLESGRHWDYTKNNPYLYMIDDSIEFIDIDTELDFIIVKSLWENYKLYD